MVALRLAHLADTHLGYESLAVLDGAGNNQRGTDTVAALAAAVDAIVAWDPPLVVHAGDVAERPQVAVRYQLEARRQLARLAGIRPDGSRRQVVVIAGNHDAPRDKRDTCWLELCADLPGVHVVTAGPTPIEFRRESRSPQAPDDLDDVVVWAVPHDSLRNEAGLAEVSPAEGRRNVLVTHGVASGSPLFLRHIGREHAIPVSLVEQGWDYVALGHWHTSGPVEGQPRVQYSGSTETFGFGDLRDGGNRRGWVSVVLDDDAIVVEHHQVRTRTFLRLGPVDASGLDAVTVTELCRKALNDADLAGAVATLVITGVDRAVWGLVDQSALRTGAAAALHFDVSVRFAAEEPVRIPRSEDAITEVLAEAAQVIPTRRRGRALTAARTYLWGGEDDQSDDGAGALADDETRQLHHDNDAHGDSPTEAAP